MNSHSSSSSSSSSSGSKHKKRKWTKEQLLRNLEILSNLSAPLPPDLPPSPPASRSSSPAPGFKRKLDHPTSSEHVKRSRTNSAVSDRPLQHHLSPPHHPLHLRHTAPTNHLRSETTEDGEVREETVASSSRTTAVLSNPVPVRRPRRGRPPNNVFDEIHDKYHQWGRMLKYSGDARFWSTFPSGHKEYRPLLNPPPPHSPYHKFGGIIARLELVDALIDFTYSIWSKDYSRKTCCRDTWTTIEGFLGWCKNKWSAETATGEREDAFVGLIWMIEAFIHGRKYNYLSRTPVDHELGLLIDKAKRDMADAADKAEEEAAARMTPGLSGPSNRTPPMLPSPASIGPSNSANSTPTSRPSGTPNPNGIGGSSSSSSNGRLHPHSTSSSLPLYMHPIRDGTPAPPGSPAAIAASKVTITITPLLLQQLKDQSTGIAAAGQCMELSQKKLNLPVMAKHFPTTFARMIYTTLAANEEYEPDIEDEEGELFWPGQLATGEGLGWVCLMGKAMVKEMGKEIGYLGLDGVVPKPKPEQEGTGLPPISAGSSHKQGQSPQNNAPIPVLARR